MLTPGAVIENCRVLGEIGAGGTGIVYKAYHTRLRKHVVLKKIKGGIAQRVNVRAEVDILKRVKHSYLPQVYDFIETDGDIFTVIDFIDGESLDYYIKNQTRFSQQTLVKWAIQLCEALDYLHTLTPPIIHSDIKPANIMITPEGNVCLIDFNISLESNTEKPLAGITQGYASPEQYIVAQKSSSRFSQDFAASSAITFNLQEYTQLLSINRIDARSDIYSLGATFYYLMTGVKPKAALEGNVPVNRLEIPFSEAFTDIIAKAMEPSIDKRYRCAADMLSSLKNLIKLDKRYRGFKLRQMVSTVLFPTLIVLFCALAAFGYNTMQKEKDSQYSRLIADGQLYVAGTEYSKALEKYAAARDLKPKEINAYYEEVRAYFKSRDYEKTITLGRELLSNENFYNTLRTETRIAADVNHMIGESFFAREEYETAARYYANAIDEDDTNSLYYRDLAIAYARSGDRERAKISVEKAEKAGLEEASLLLVSGELKIAEAEYAGAVVQLEKVLSSSSESEIQFRAYYLIAECYKNLNDIDNQIATLEKARTQFSQDINAPILQQLGAAYSLKAQQSTRQKSEYEKKALDVFLILYQNGNPTETLLTNIAYLYHLSSDFKNAEQFLNEALSVSPSSYRVYVRLALLEADKQSKVTRERRDYGKVGEYYDQAAVLYQPERVKGVSDPEMAQLDALVSKLKEEEWLQ